ncbi:MAG: class I SAM-dependent methyltransferase [Chloroflexi bacterium]|nr:class I SAM-dependent methyltransferase [Chloroflexota bacterium]
MYEHKTIEMNRRSWDTISAHYQASTRISTDDVHYGFLAPGERELGLLGDGSAETCAERFAVTQRNRSAEASPRSVVGKRVIEIGCGGGQNSIALSKWGATCVGIDPSPAQIAHARRLALENGVEAQFVEGMAEDLSAFPDGSFDIALSSYAFDYVTDLRRAYDEAWRVLRSPDPTAGKPGGLFVFCLSHPWFQAVGWHLSGDPDAPEIGDYAAWPNVQEFDWTYDDGTTARLRDHLRTLEQIVNELMEAGFVLERLVEQNIEVVAKASPEELARLPYVSKFDPASQEYQILRKLPHTLIIRARKGASQYG